MKNPGRAAGVFHYSFFALIFRNISLSLTYISPEEIITDISGFFITEKIYILEPNI